MIEKLYHIYTSENKPLKFWFVRPEIENYLLKSQQIKRFQTKDIPEGAINDTVFTHTNRCLLLSDTLPLDPYNKSLIKLTLILHDLPEVVSLLEVGKTSDVTSPEKESNEHLNQSVSNLEMQTAQKIFTPFELHLYECFEEAGNFLKGCSYNLDRLNTVGIFAHLIDKIDGNLTYHSNMSAKNLLSENSQTFAFRQYSKFIESIHTFPDENTQKVAISLLKNQMSLITRLWK